MALVQKAHGGNQGYALTCSASHRNLLAHLSDCVQSLHRWTTGEDCSEGVIGVGIGAVPDGAHVFTEARAHLIGKTGKLPKEARLEAVVETEHVVEHEHLTVGGGTRTDADRWYGQRARDIRGQRV